MTHRRPYDQDAQGAADELRHRVEAFLTDCREHHWHIGVAVEVGVLLCAVCETSWPCGHQRDIERAFHNRQKT